MARTSVFWALTLTVVLSLNSVKCSNILGLMGVTSPSHHIWNSVLLHELARRGHNVTVLSVDLPKDPKDVPAKVTYIHLEEAYKVLYEAENAADNLDVKEFIEIEPMKLISLMYGSFGMKSCQGVVKSRGFQTLLDYPDDFKFDLVIHDYVMGSCLLGFVHKFKNPPIVGVSPYLNSPNTVDMIGGHTFPGYIPYASVTYDTDMGLFQRIHNTMLFAYDAVYRRYIYTPALDKLIRPRFAADMPYLADLEKRTVLALVNSHPAVTYPESLPPNVIEVGGLQIVDPRPLPKDLEEFVQKGRKGAILFSLGTNMRSQDMGPEKVKIILDAMAQLPEYNFLWKFDLDQLKLDVPQNVLIRSFYPQRDILAHPKTKAFVSHAGALSTHEATWRGVPIIGIPLFADQHRNLHKTILAGAAEKVDYFTMTTDILRDTIKKVVEDDKYARNMKLRSIRFRSRPTQPLETAVWWVEYVLKNPNPEHLKSPTLKQGLIASYSLDVLFIILAIFGLLLSTVFWFFGFITRTTRVQGRRSTKSHKYE